MGSLLKENENPNAKVIAIIQLPLREGRAGRELPGARLPVNPRGGTMGGSTTSIIDGASSAPSFCILHFELASTLPQTAPEHVLTFAGDLSGREISMNIGLITGRKSAFSRARNVVSVIYGADASKKIPSRRRGVLGDIL